MEKWRGAMPSWKRGMTPLVIALHRVRKMLGGAYGNRDVNTAFYTRLSGGRRKEAVATGVSFGWPEAAAPVTEGGLAARPRFTRRRSSYDVAFQNKMPDPKTEKQRETLATAAAFVVALLIILLDLQIKELTIAPFFCTLVILTLTFLLPPARLTIIALALMPVVLFSLRFSQPFRPGQAIDWMRIALRLGSFGIACSLAILFSAYRLRSARLASQTLDVLRRMPAPVIVSDAAGIVRFANRAASELLGRAQNELEDASYLALLMSDEDEGTASRAYRAAFEGSTDKTHEIVLSPRAGAGGKLTAQTATIGERENRLLVTLVNPASMRRAG
jgi:PAS domain S-box-containing protein